jgi:CopG antitoxin of type II toxin-antitoxin system
MAQDTRKPRETLHSLDDIPAFASEAEEAAFWDDHGLGEEVLAAMAPLPDGVLPPARPRTKPLALRLDESTLQRVKALARRRHQSYQTLLRDLVTERLAEEEQREARTGS